MSTLVQAKYSRIRNEKESTFKQLVQRDPDICNNCFRRTHLSEKRGAAIDTYREDGETHLWSRPVTLPDRKWPRFDKTQFMLSDRMTGGTHRGCICGVPHTTIRPVSKPVAMKHVERLLDRLDEKGFDKDRNTARRYAWKLLSDPDMQGRQDELFGKITEL